MADLFRDDDLDTLIRELNRGDRAPGDTAEAARDTADDDLARLLAVAASRGATDLLLVPGAPPMLRVDGALEPAHDDALDSDGIRSLLVPYTHDRHWSALAETGSADLSIRLTAGRGTAAFRFRANLHRQRGGLAASVRALPRTIPTFAALGLPPVLAELVRAPRGLVLVCGPTGAGKSTTLAAMVGEINRTRRCHVVTVEDPVEYEHTRGTALVEQIEIGADAPSFAAALKAALRQDPDVLLVGEMRDLETIAIALTAAETGHLVLSTLHTGDAAQAIHRIVDVFPALQQGQIRHQLALSLHAVVGQQLLPRADRPGRAAAVEILLANGAVRQHIRREREHNLYNEIVLGKRAGMVTFEDSLARLVREGAVNREEALLRAAHPAELESLLREG